jgi:peptidoglycan hydrolase-like protein with peptidoglycan-binding domain
MAYFNANEERNAIFQIQRALRDLELSDTGVGKIRLTGSYDEETRQGVKDFQKKYDLPVTGVVDHTTWQVLQAVHKARQDNEALARAVYLLPRQEDYSLYPGLRDDAVYIIQYMLNTIGQEYDEIPRLDYTGVYDAPTENAIREFQRKQLIEPDGILSPSAFNRLADEYERINSYNQ